MQVCKGIVGSLSPKGPSSPTLQKANDTDAIVKVERSPLKDRNKSEPQLRHYRSAPAAWIGDSLPKFSEEDIMEEGCVEDADLSMRSSPETRAALLNLDRAVHEGEIPGVLSMGGSEAHSLWQAVSGKGSPVSESSHGCTSPPGELADGRIGMIAAAYQGAHAVMQCSGSRSLSAVEITALPYPIEIGRQPPDGIDEVPDITKKAVKHQAAPPSVKRCHSFQEEATTPMAWRKDLVELARMASEHEQTLCGTTRTQCTTPDACATVAQGPAHLAVDAKIRANRPSTFIWKLSVADCFGGKHHKHKIEYPWSIIFELWLLWGAFCTVQVFKGKQKKCSSIFWVLYCIQIVLMVAASIVFSWQAIRAYRKQRLENIVR